MPRLPRWPELTLQFDRNEVPSLAQQYDDAEDTKALEAGKSIQEGHYPPGILVPIVRWKSARSLPLVAGNPHQDVTDALRLAVAAETKRSAIAVLTGLRGVGIPVASAIMTAIAPEEFTIIDFRALEALGVKRDKPVVLSVDFYLHYLTVCGKLARECRVALRALDRALWQWSNERGD